MSSFSSVQFSSNSVRAVMLIILPNIKCTQISQLKGDVARNQNSFGDKKKTLGRNRTHSGGSDLLWPNKPTGVV